MRAKKTLLSDAFRGFILRTAPCRGQMWYIATDVTEALGFQKSCTAWRTLPKKWKAYERVTDPRGLQGAMYEHASGLMYLIHPTAVIWLLLQSRRPQAVKARERCAQALSKMLGPQALPFAEGRPSPADVWNAWRVERRGAIQITKARSTELRLKTTKTFLLSRGITLSTENRRRLAKRAAFLSKRKKVETTAVFTPKGRRKGYTNAVLKEALQWLQSQPTNSVAET